MKSLHALMNGLIDYAGLFPPANLDMSAAVAEYHRHQAQPASWVLGRFICPVSRFDEFAIAAAGAIPQDQSWAISAILGQNLPEDLDQIEEFERRMEGKVRVSACEVKVGGVKEIDAALETLPEEWDCYCEIPWNVDFRGLIAALSGTRVGAKLRTGGIEPAAFPPTEAMSRFIVACRDADVPVKMTAGMHHPVRHYDRKIGCRMHGFFNAFIGAIACRVFDLDAKSTQCILDIEDEAAFRFSDEGVAVLEHRLETDAIADARHWARSFGSCSFDEPVADLKRLGLL